MTNAAQLKIRLPSEIKVFLAAQAEKNCTTLNSEVVRALRERMERMSTVARR